MKAWSKLERGVEPKRGGNRGKEGRKARGETPKTHK